MSLKIDRVQLEIIVQQDKARQKMLDLEKSMRDANTELAKIKKQFGENSDEYRAQQRVIRDLKQQYDDLFNDIGIGSLSLRELTNRQRELNAILRNLSPNLPEWKRYNDQLTQVNNRIKELRGTATKTGLSIGKLADGFNRYAAVGASAVATLTGMTLTMRQCVDEYAKMDEAQSQVVKYAQLTKEETRQLNDQFRRMDTRTAREELNRLGGEAGKLGITGVQDVMEFVEAADRINVALGEDLGEDAVNQIGKLSQMFGDQNRSLKANMLAIGSAVNQVAQSTSASEPYLVDFTARMGGVGKQAGMAVTDIMGFASALDQNMLRSEMASTALSGLIMRIYQEPAKYARLAGMEVEQFTRLVETDANEAVITFLEALNRMGGMAQIAPILKEMKLSGAEAASVISTLAGNVELVRREQENANRAFTEGTSIDKEYAVQNSTVQAGLDKARKSFQEVRIEMGERLLPVMKGMLSTGTLSIQAFGNLLRVLYDYRAVLAATAAAVATYTATVKIAQLWEKKFKDEKLASVAASKLQDAAYKAQRGSVLLLAAGQAALAGNLGKARAAMRLFNMTLKASPVGMILSAVSVLGVAVYSLASRTDKATASVKAMTGELLKEQQGMDALFAALRRAEPGTQRRRELLEAINSQYAEYLPFLLDERTGLEELETAYRRANTAMTEHIALKYRDQEIAEATSDAADAQIALVQDIRQAVADETGSDKLATMFVQDMRRMAQAATETGTDYRRAVASALAALQREYLGGKVISQDMKADVTDFMNSVYRLDKQVERIQKKYDGWMPDPADKNRGTGYLLDEVTVTAPLNPAPKPTGGGDKMTDEELEAAEKAIDQRLEQQKAAAKALLLQATQSHTDLEAAQEQYNKDMYEAEVAALAERSTLLEKAGKDTSEVQGQIYDKMIAEANRLYAKQKEEQQKQLDGLDKQQADETARLKQSYVDGLVDEKAYREQLLELERLYLLKRRDLARQLGMDTAEPDAALLEFDFDRKQEADKAQGEADKQRVKDGMKAIGSTTDTEQQNRILQDLYDRDLISYEQYQDTKTRIAEQAEEHRRKTATTAMQTISQAAGTASQLISAMQDRETSQVEARYDKEIEAAQKAGRDTTKLEEEKQEALNAVKKKYADKQFAANILQIASDTAVAIMRSYAQLGPIFGSIYAAIVAAQGAAQIAVAKQQRDEAKGLKSGGYSDEYVEGYTRRGNPDDTAGVIPVHKNEFVANHEAVANPAVRQFLDVFDLAQKRGTIRMLNTTQILEQVRTRGGKYEGGYSGKGAAATPAASLQPGELTADQRSQIVMLLVENNRLLAILCRKELVVDPRKIRDSLRRLERLEDNVSR